MTRPVRPNAEAEDEFRQYIRWYENESVGLGDRLWTEIEAAIDLISDHPAWVVAERFAACLFDIFRLSSSIASAQIISKS